MLSFTTMQKRHLAATVLACVALALPSVAAGQDLRTPDAVSAGSPAATTDLRTPDAVAAGIPAAITDLRSPDAVDAGVPASEPVTVVADDGTGWIVYALGAALIVAMSSALVVGARRSRVQRAGAYPSR